jgi:hypothetical protein
MKFVLVALAAVLAVPGAALAQAATSAPAPAQSGAAATLPNTFDGPQAAAPRAASPAAPRPAPTPAPDTTPSSPAKVAAAEAALKTTIAAMQAGTPNYGDMSDDLAAKVREQSANVLPLFQQLGALQSVTHVGTQDGAELFAAVFANAPTQWIIAQSPEGKIVALLFRPAPPPAA